MIEISLYKLSRNDTPMSGELTACIIAAANEKQAREIANQESSAEGYVWTDGHLVDCQLIGKAEDGVSGIVLSSKE